MIEIPESNTIGQQVVEALTGKKIAEVFLATSPHRFTFSNGDPALYPALLIGKTIQTGKGYGAFVDMVCDDDTNITIGDGANMSYHSANDSHPDKYQLLIAFDDKGFLVFTVAM